MNPQNNLPFPAVAGAIEVKKASNGAVSLLVDWPFLLNNKLPKNTIASHISLTHTEFIATAIVILEKTNSAIAWKFPELWAIEWNEYFYEMFLYSSHPACAA